MLRFFENVFGQKNKFTLERLEQLHVQLTRANAGGAERNSAVVIETVRQIAELLIWGDQHNEKMFELSDARRVEGDDPAPPNPKLRLSVSAYSHVCPHCLC